MPLNYHSNYGPDTQGIEQVGSSIGGLIGGHPLLRLQAEQFRQRLALQKAQEVLHQVQAQRAQAQIGTETARQGDIGAQQREREQKTQAASNMEASAERGGQAATLGDLFSGNVDNPILNQEVQRGMQMGLIPSEGFQGSRGGIVDALNAITRGRAVRNAMTTGPSAANLLAPHDIPQGGTGINSLRDVVGMGQPKPLMVGHNQMAVVGDQPPVYGPALVGRGQELTLDPTLGGPPDIVGQSFPDTQHLGNALSESLKMIGDSTTSPEGLAYAHQIMSKGGFSGQTPSPKSQQEYDAIPSGTVYIDTDGKTKRKK